jgi:hypothetical protein
MMYIHDLAREFLATDGLKIRDTQKAGIFLFADWLLENGYVIQPQPDEQTEPDTVTSAAFRRHEDVGPAVPR